MVTISVAIYSTADLKVLLISVCTGASLLDNASQLMYHVSRQAVVCRR